MKVFGAALVLAAAFCATAEGGATIVVNLGKHASAEAAAQDEANVNWRDAARRTSDAARRTSDADTRDDTVCTECFAATELREYLSRMTGAEIRIADDEPTPDDDPAAGPPGEAVRIVIGSPKSNRTAERLWGGAPGVEGLGREGFVIRSATAAGRRVIFIGGEERVGTLYGVYDFLERLGVRWFGPGKTNEHVPRRALEEIPDMNVREQPAFSTRGFWAWEDRGNEDFFDWMARNKMNLWTDAQSNHPALKKRGLLLTCGGHLHQHEFLSPRAEYPYKHPKFPRDSARPDDPYPISADFRGDTNGDGKLQYSEAHPEWYGLRLGKRSFNIHGDGGDNFCTSNPHACSELMKNVVQCLIDGKWQDADSINFWTLDGGKWCECEDCKALGTPTDRNLLLVHRLRAEIKKAMKEQRLHRNVQIAFLAYADVIEPPTRALPADFDYENCTATFFPIGRCYVHTFDDPTCTEINQRYVKQYVGWAADPQRHYQGQIFIGEYYNVSVFKCLPIVFRHTMSSDIPHYHRTGARHMHYMHCTTRNWGTRALTNYQMAKMLWKPGLDAEALFADYLAGRYGAAKETMRECYLRLERALANCRLMRGSLAKGLERDAPKLFPFKHMRYEEFHPETDDGPDFVEMVRHVDRARGLIEEAAKQALTPDQAARVEEDRQGLMYAWNTIHFYDRLIRTVTLKREGKFAEAGEAYRDASALAKVLEADTESASYASSHAGARNALAASMVVGSYRRLKQELEAEDPAKVRTLEPGKSLTIFGTEFAGGGQVLYHAGIKIGGRTLSAKGNYIYAQRENPYHMMTTYFRVGVVPAKARLAVVGMSCPVERGTQVPIRISLNGRAVFEGEGPFPEGKLSRQEYDIPAGALKTGTNRLTIENMLKEGHVGARPWFGVDSVELLAQ